MATIRVVAIFLIGVAAVTGANNVETRDEADRQQDGYFEEKLLQGQSAKINRAVQSHNGSHAYTASQNVTTGHNAHNTGHNAHNTTGHNAHNTGHNAHNTTGHNAHNTGHNAHNTTGHNAHNTGHNTHNTTGHNAHNTGHNTHNITGHNTHNTGHNTHNTTGHNAHNTTGHNTHNTGHNTHNTTHISGHNTHNATGHNTHNTTHTSGHNAHNTGHTAHNTTQHGTATVYHPPVVGFHVTLTTDFLTIPHVETVVLNHLLVNQGRAYDVTHGHFTASVSGLYSFTANIHFRSSNTAELNVSIVKNGDDIGLLYLFGSGTSIRSTVVFLVVGDIVWLKNNVDNSPKIYGGGRSTFSGFLIAPVD